MTAGAIDPARLPGHGRLILAYSGGPDSLCLLHLLTRSKHDRELICIHVDHGLDEQSGARALAAADAAERLGVACRIETIEVGGGGGPESAARDGRYAVLKSAMAHGDTLLTAHHADDQTETVLLRLIRGAGPGGLAGIRAVRPFGPGWLARPLLDWPRTRIDAWIERYALTPVSDPSNAQLDFDRNFLRHEIIPRLQRRWPGVDRSLRRSARLCRGADEFAVKTVDDDLQGARKHDGALAIDALSDRSQHYLATVIRSWCILRGVEPPPGRQLDSFLTQLGSAAADRLPELRWPGWSLRAWRRHLWLERDLTHSLPWRRDWTGEEPLELPNDTGRLLLSGGAGPAVQLTVQSGTDGESLRPAGDTHHRACKRLLAESGVPPWQRAMWPRVWSDGQLVALGARWLEAEFAKLLESRQQSLTWQPGPRRLSTAGLESRS